MRIRLAFEKVPYDTEIIFIIIFMIIITWQSPWLFFFVPHTEAPTKHHF